MNIIYRNGSRHVCMYVCVCVCVCVYYYYYYYYYYCNNNINKLKNIYIRLIYSMAWKFICNLRFREVLQSSDIEHSPNYIAHGLPQTHKVN